MHNSPHGRQQLKWREPRLLGLRLHRDLPTRLVLCIFATLATASIFYVAGHFEREGNPLWAAALGGTLIGFVISLGIVFRPEPLLAGSVRIKDGVIYHVQSTFSYGEGVHETAKWNCRELTCAIVPAEAIPRSFSILVLPKGNSKHALLGIPRRVDLDELRPILQNAGATVSLAPELAPSVVANRPYGRFVVTAVIATCVVITVASAVAVVVAG